MFTLHVANRDYTEWTYLDEKKEITHLDLSPLTHKLFHGDTISAEGKVISSPYRAKENICGVLLTSQKTYGRMTTGTSAGTSTTSAGTSTTSAGTTSTTSTSTQGNRLLYKCIPDDEHLPCFLVPYEEKQLGFNKTQEDKYITFKLKEWKAKHPLGLITNTFGEVKNTEAYTAYQMACKELNDSLKTLNAASLRTLRQNTLGPIPLYCDGIPIEDRRALRIISIDPEGCNDIDDAMGMRKLPNGQMIFSIYIANVPMMLEYLQLWPYLTDRVSTIYLPYKKYPMLPVALSENICSLKEKADRVAFVMDIHLKNMSIQSISYTSAIICLEKNYAYEASELLAREDYKSILETVKELNYNFRYLDKIANSHDIVEYCMLFMNRECAKKLRAKKCGIFRSAMQASVAEASVAEASVAAQAQAQAPPELKRILQATAGEYCGADQIKPHELIGGGLDCYLHITSPIRRLVDIINMCELLQESIPWSAEAKVFLAKWQKPEQIKSINQKTKASRKLQNEMELLQTYEKNPDRTYMGLLFNKTQELDKALFKYKVYIAETKMLTSIFSTEDIAEFTSAYFSAHLFLDEAKMTKKIRLQML
jgi:exoribonuclease R